MNAGHQTQSKNCMNTFNRFFYRMIFGGAVLLIAGASFAAETPPKVPRFSVSYMDRSVDPGADFFHYACGAWLKENPVPPDKARWGGFTELSGRKRVLTHQILDSTAATAAPANSPAQKVGDFFKSATDTNRLEQLSFKPLEADL